MMKSRCSECDIRLLADRASLPGQSGRPEKPVSGRVLTVDTSDADTYCEEILSVVIPQMGWKEVKTRPKDHACDITWFPVKFGGNIKSGQVNNFPGSHVVCEKINLYRWLVLMQSVFPEDYNFFPDTWLLPEELDIFTDHVKPQALTSSSQKPIRNHEARWRPGGVPNGMTKNNTCNDDKSAYIVKPTDGYSAKGVYLLQQPEEYVASQNGDIVQEYISDPLLVEGFKMDFRLHVYVHSLFPLSLYICREGHVRLATVPYQKPSKENMAESCMHVTNYSHNIFQDNYIKSEDDHHGSLRRLSVVFKTMEEQGHDILALWAKIDHLATRTVQAIAGQIRVDTVAAGSDSDVYGKTYALSQKNDNREDIDFKNL
ncbi:tubulin polyglutamylase TTLL11 [Aplysia californica]|uniref:Tubulin polyglutamylase TTLL11 n=1 Tax=Aplysia californica TaxID=6500 RepID=A0ABM0JGC4_APLCA|nr:tubulin polyglutamylase TTLL11 [Aplysia californica]